MHASTVGIEFTDTYASVHNKYEPIVGIEPSGTDVGLPVFVWVMGTGDAFGSHVDRTWLEAMASRGFITGAVDYPNSMSRLIGRSLLGPARAFSDFKSKAEELPDAISKLCARPRANCSEGVAMAGHSQGGFMTLFGLQLDRRIKAVLAMGVGCIDSYLPNELTDGAISKYLDGSKRLYIDGAQDAAIDVKCLPTMAPEHPAGGGGRLLVPRAQHMFYGTCDPTRAGTRMKCAYARSTEPWGLKAALDWLAATASPSRARISAQLDAVDCEDQPIDDTPECGSTPFVLIGILVGCIVLCGCICFACFRCLCGKGEYDSVDDESSGSDDDSAD